MGLMVVLGYGVKKRTPLIFAPYIMNLLAKCGGADILLLKVLIKGLLRKNFITIILMVSILV